MSYPVRHLVPDSPEGEKLFPLWSRSCRRILKNSVHDLWPSASCWEAQAWCCIWGRPPWPGRSMPRRHLRYKNYNYHMIQLWPKTKWSHLCDFAENRYRENWQEL